MYTRLFAIYIFHAKYVYICITGNFAHAYVLVCIVDYCICVSPLCTVLPYYEKQENYQEQNFLWSIVFKVIFQFATAWYHEKQVAIIRI